MWSGTEHQFVGAAQEGRRNTITGRDTDFIDMFGWMSRTRFSRLGAQYVVVRSPGHEQSFDMERWGRGEPLSAAPERGAQTGRFPRRITAADLVTSVLEN